MKRYFSFQKMDTINKKQANISKLICDNYPFLCALVRTKSEKKRRRMLRLSNVEQLLSLVEVCLNIVKAHFPLTSRQRTRLMPYADFVRKMSKVRSERGARKLVVQHGTGVSGLFPALLTPILIALSHSLKN